MKAGRVLALSKKEWKRMLREPAVLFMIILFPVMLTVAFGASFGATAGSQPSTYSTAVVSLGTGVNSTWSGQFVQGLSNSGVLKVQPYSNNATAQSALSQGQVQAVVVIPGSFDASVQSYRSHPSDPALWQNSSISLYVDKASLVSAQVIPSVVQQVLNTVVLGVKPTAVPSPVSISNLSLVQSTPQTVFDTFVPGLFSFASIFLIMMVAQSFTGDRESGILRRIIITPTAASEVMTSQVLAYLVIGAVQALLVFLSAYALGYRPSVGLGAVALGLGIASVFSISNVGFGLITATISRTAGAATGISFLFLLPQMFLGTYVSMALSSSAQVASRFVPSFYVTDALISLFTRGAAITSTAVVSDLAIVGMFSVAILLAGTALFRRFGRI